MKHTHMNFSQHCCIERSMASFKMTEGSTTTFGMSGVPEAEIACFADFFYETFDQILRLLAHGLRLRDYFSASPVFEAIH